MSTKQGVVDAEDTARESDCKTMAIEQVELERCPRRNGQPAAAARLRRPFASFDAPAWQQVDTAAAAAPSMDVPQAPNLEVLLPATHRTKEDDIVPPVADLKFLQQELLVESLNAIQHWLWMCGRPMPPRPLHNQVLLSRQIVVTEDPQLHLVWGDKRIFLKPLPRYLLDMSFWERRILRNDDPAFRKVEGCARGFLFSYCALIAYESDFRIASERGLIPDDMSWERWRQLSRQIVKDHCYSTVNPRYWYGELRLSRLNKIYRIKMGYFFRGYSRVTGHAVYGDLVRDNFTTLASILGYVVIVLTAAQVGLATNKLESNKAFQDISYGFTVFSIMAPLAATAAILAFVLFWAIVNYIHTLKYERKRFQSMGVEASWRVQSEKTLVNQGAINLEESRR